MGRHRLKALGLMFLAALCLTIFMTSSAQANWLILGVEPAVNKEITISTHELIILLVPSLGLALDCIIGSEDMLLLAHSPEILGTLTFKSCTTKINGTSNPKCDPINQPIKLKVKGRIVLIGTKNLILLEPETAGGKFGTIEFGVECAVTETNDVSGKLLLESLTEALAPGDCSEELKSHLVKQQARVEDVLRFGKRELFLDGVAKAVLTAEPTEKWSCHV